MEGKLCRDFYGTWFVRWTDSVSCGKETEYFLTELSPTSSMLQIIENGQIFYKHLEEDKQVSFKFERKGNNHFRYAKLIFPKINNMLKYKSKEVVYAEQYFKGKDIEGVKIGKNDPNNRLDDTPDGPYVVGEQYKHRIYDGDWVIKEEDSDYLTTLTDKQFKKRYKLAKKQDEK